MIILFIGIIFSLIAGAMAFLITYAEYEKHFPDYKRKVWQLSFESAAVFFFFFAALSVTLAFIFGNLIPNFKP